MAGNWDSNVAQAAVAVAARSAGVVAVGVRVAVGVGVAVRVAVTTLMIGVVIAGAQVGQIGGATDVSGHIAVVGFSAQPSTAKYRTPDIQSEKPMIKLTNSPSRKPSNWSRLMNLLRRADCFLIFGSVFFAE